MRLSTLLAPLVFAYVAVAQTHSTEDHQASRVKFPTYTNGRVAFTTSFTQRCPEIQRTYSPSEEDMSAPPDPDTAVAATTPTSSDSSVVKRTPERLSQIRKKRQTTYCGLA